MNLAWSKSFFWDGGIFHLDLFPISPITNPVEMNEKMENILAKLRLKNEYREWYKALYGSEEITGIKAFKALSQIMIMCVSSNSKYDSLMHKTGAKLTDAEQKGLAIFRKDCSTCHKEPLFTDGSFRKNGLNHNFNPDSGRQAITLAKDDRFKFKVPSLRNLTYTVPYMHDERFTKIDQVLDHYVKGVQNSPTLDPVLRKNGTLGIPLTAEDRVSLKAFLKCPDDRYFTKRSDLSEQ